MLFAEATKERCAALLWMLSLPRSAGGHMFWKAFSIYSVIATVLGCVLLVMRFPAIPPFEAAGMAITWLSCVGLVAYAFDLRVLSGRTWLIYSWILAAWSVVAVVHGAIVIAPDFPDATWTTRLGLLAGVVVAALVMFLAWLGVRRYGLRQAALERA